MKFSIETKGFNEVIDITDKVREIVRKAKVSDGLCVVFCPCSTCAITTIEFEEGAIQDLKRILDKIAPMEDNYEHCKKWGDCNGYAHIRSALLKPFFCCPIENGDLALGTWQQLVFIDFDNKARRREIIVKIV